MNADKLTNNMQQKAVHDEQIVVLPRVALAPFGLWHGFSTNHVQEILVCIEQCYQLHPRSAMENDPTFKQIIPYLVVKHKDSYFVMQRTAHASEQRLRNKLSLGVGGHLRQEDMRGSRVVDWALREWHEEVDYHDDYTVEVLGLLNDDSNPVGQVHLGCVLLVHASTNAMTVKSELKSGQFMTYDECIQRYDQFESWSQIVLDFVSKIG